MNSVDHPNVVLTGFMGTGKSTVGRLLAELLSLEFVDTDAVIEHRHGRIPDIFREHGESAFRQMERDVADELAERTGLVIATGGRMLLDRHNVDALGRNGQIFCLVADPDRILERVTTDQARAERPLLSVPDPRRRIVDLLAERSVGYGRFTQVPTDDSTPAEVAARLVDLVRMTRPEPVVEQRDR